MQSVSSKRQKYTVHISPETEQNTATYTVGKITLYSRGDKQPVVKLKSHFHINTTNQGVQQKPEKHIPFSIHKRKIISSYALRLTDRPPRLHTYNKHHITSIYTQPKPEHSMLTPKYTDIWNRKSQTTWQLPSVHHVTYRSAHFHSCRTRGDNSLQPCPHHFDLW